MNGPFHHPILIRLDDGLWPAAEFGRRSRELTPLYVDRFYGPRIAGPYNPHPFWELGAVKEGAGELRTGDVLTLRPGMVFLIPPGLGHTEFAAGNIDILWVGLRGTLLDPLPTDAPLWVVSAPLTDRVEALWITAVKRRVRSGPELDGLARTLVAEFVGRSEQDGASAETDRIGDLAVHLRRHLAEPVRAGSLAKRLGCSEGHMRRQFKARTGFTPAHYLTCVRIEHALRLLEHSHLPVADVARQSGYEDPFYFCRVFQKLVGASPLKYRQSRRPASESARPRRA